MARVLQANHIENIAKLYVLREPDLGGERFVTGVATRLRAIEWKGEAYVLTLPQGIKDLNDLHKANAAGFNAALELAFMNAPRLASVDSSVEAHDGARNSVSKKEPPQTDLLLQLAEDIELHDPNQDPFASFQVGEHTGTADPRPII
jgi:hypothetical protein